MYITAQSTLMWPTTALTRPYIRMPFKGPFKRNLGVSWSPRVEAVAPWSVIHELPGPAVGSRGEVSGVLFVETSGLRSRNLKIKLIIIQKAYYSIYIHIMVTCN